MTILRRLPAPVGVGLILGAFAALIGLGKQLVAQGAPPIVGPLTGQEIVYVIPLQANGQLGAVQAQVTIAQIAGFAAASTVSTTATGTVTATTPTTILSVPLTGAVTFTLPATPTDGQQAVLVNGSGRAFTQTITVVGAGTPAATVTGSPTIVAMPAGGSARWRYTAATTTWTRIG